MSQTNEVGYESFYPDQTGYDRFEPIKLAGDAYQNQLIELLPPSPTPYQDPDQDPDAGMLELDAQLQELEKEYDANDNSPRKTPNKFRTPKKKTPRKSPYKSPAQRRLEEELAKKDEELSDSSQQTQDWYTPSTPSTPRSTPRPGDRTGSVGPSTPVIGVFSPNPSAPSSPAANADEILFEDDSEMSKKEVVNVHGGIIFQISPSDESWESRSVAVQMGRTIRHRLYKVDNRGNRKTEPICIKSSLDRDEIIRYKNKCEDEYEKHTMNLLCAGKVMTLDRYGADRLEHLNQKKKQPRHGNEIFENVIEYVNFHVIRYMKACSSNSGHNSRNITAMLQKQQELMNALNVVFGELISDNKIMSLDWKVEEVSNTLQYTWEMKDKQEFKSLWNTTMILSYNKRDLIKKNYYDKSRDRGFNTLKLKEKRKRDEEGKMYWTEEVDDFIEMLGVPLADWWLGEADHRRFLSVVWEPDTTRCAKGSVNTWTGYAYGPDYVKEYKDWRKCAFILRHLKYTLCDLKGENGLQDDLQFEEFLGRHAFFLQKPGVLPEVMICIGKCFFVL